METIRGASTKTESTMFNVPKYLKTTFSRIGYQSAVAFCDVPKDHFLLFMSWIDAVRRTAR
ncbi:MAG: hypothetical protein PF482_01230 [Desulfobacteraceae bacterium]|nr:hypothetical protein [Desulfobacteraceae bacterium]